MKTFNYVEVTYIPEDKRCKKRVQNLVVSETRLISQILDFHDVDFVEVRKREFHGSREDFESILN
jgi:hypothetical protein|tara:strand:+ start:2102 stop:2296 length:195 start_codon:yes stop_codon:yes gene_type:complete